MTRPSPEAVSSLAVGAPPAAWASPGARSGGATDPWARFGWLMAVVWLVFLIYPLLALLRSQAPVGWVVAGWVALISFIVIYVAGFIWGMRQGSGLGRPVPTRQWISFALLIVCAPLAIPAVGGNALSFLPFIMSFASYGLTRIWHWITFGAALVITAAVILLTPDGTEFTTLIVIVGLLGLVNTVSTWLILRSVEADQLGLELATSEGREAVARDVHDLVGHSLTVVGLKAQLVRRLMDTDPERARAELADIEALTGEAIASIRATVAGARATTLVEQLASSESVLGDGGVTWEVDGEAVMLSAAQALTAAWILREATTNTLRHATATTFRVRIAPGSFVVLDDGPGPGGREGNGVRGMRERAAASGATFGFGSDAGGGTRVEVSW